MKLRPFPHQLAGAAHLAPRKIAGLFDDPRVGKNLATIMALDQVGAKNILVVTTVSGCPVLAKAFRENQTIPRKVRIVKPKDPLQDGISIVSWDSLNTPMQFSKLIIRRYDAIILDESHKAKNFSAKRTRAVYGRPLFDGRQLDQTKALVKRSEIVWLLTGTPLPHDLSDAYPMMRALMPELLRAHNGMPDVTTMTEFDRRYTIQKLMKVSPRFSKMIKIGGQNEGELRQRLNGKKFFLRRTQAQIGILPPRYSLRPIESDEFDAVIEQGMDREEIVAILERGGQDKNLAALLHQHGIIKAHAVVDAVREEFDCGLDRIVLGYWHRSVGDILAEGLYSYGVARIDGQTPPQNRERVVSDFTNGGARVFLQQLAAAGESIDLSASSLLWFVESVFQPATMKQAAERVTNLNNRTAPVVETCFISGSIDELIQGRLLTLWSAINRVIEGRN